MLSISTGPLPSPWPRKNKHDHDRGGSIEGVGGHRAAPRVPRFGTACRDRKSALKPVVGPDAARAEGAPHDHVDGFVSLSQLGPTSKPAIHDGLTALALAVRPPCRTHTARCLLVMAALGTTDVDVEAKGA